MIDKRKFIEITAIKQKQGILQCITFLESLPFLFLKCQKVGKSAEKSWSKSEGGKRQNNFSLVFSRFAGEAKAARIGSNTFETLFRFTFLKSFLI